MATIQRPRPTPKNSVRHLLDPEDLAYVDETVDDMLRNRWITDDEAHRLRHLGPKQVEHAYLDAITDAWAS